TALLKLSLALSIEHPRAYRAALALPQLLLHAWALRAIYRWTRRRVEGSRALGIAVAAAAFQGLVLAYAGRTLGESISASLFWMALEVVDRPGDSARDGVWSGVLLGLTVVARYASGAAVVGVLLYLAARGPRRRLLWVCIGGLVPALGL